MANEPNSEKKEADGLPQRQSESDSSAVSPRQRRTAKESDRTVITGANTRSLFHRGEALIGATLDNRFRIDQPIASSGTGEVFRGVELVSERPVALKILAPALASDIGMLRRFQKEVSYLRRINNPAVVDYYFMGYDSDLDLHYIAAEFIAGETLETLAETGSWPGAATIPLLVTLAELLASIHGLGVVHRDITPSNILLRDGDPYRPVLIDFGIAHLSNAFEERITSNFRPAFEGTLGYAAPEAFGLFGGQFGPYTDIYGLGLVVYELTTGRKPFEQSNFAEAIQQRSTIPDMRGIERHLATLLTGMLAPDPLRRISTKDVIAGLTQNEAEARWSPPPKSASASHRSPRRRGFLARIFGLSFDGPHGPGGSEDD